MNEGKVYLLKDAYYDLDDEGKFIIGEIIRFCEENNRFPKEKEISKKNGYVARSKIFKYFNSNSFSAIYDYIEKIDEEAPKSMVCIICGEEKPFTNEFFGVAKISKFGLSHECRECINERSTIKYFNEKGLNIKTLDDLTIYEWYELALEKVIRRMPKRYLNEDCYSKIIRYILLKKNNVSLKKEDILNIFKGQFIKENGISMWVVAMGGKISCLNKCFPEINFTQKDLIKYTEEDDMNILERNFEEQSVSVIDILDGKFNARKNNELRNLLSRNILKNIGTNDLYIRYFKYKDINHPISGKEICAYDFNNKPCGFFEDENSRRGAIRHYCENICQESILESIKNTKDLIKWIKKHFKQKDVVNIMNYDKYYCSLYECLIDAYPCIVENKVLFDWEWPQFNCTSKNVLIKELRDFVLYRIPNIKNIKEEAPKYINRTYIGLHCPKIVKHIDRNRFDNFYEWAILSFPEYKDCWNKSMFNIIESYDGYEFDSNQEKCVYEYIKDNFFKFITPIGRKRVGNYVFKNEESIYSKYCPDYVVEYLNINDIKTKIDKPIIIEYYGLYDESNTTSEIMCNYRRKTKEKEKFYKNNKDIYYIGIYPKHIKPNFKGLNELCNYFIENNLKVWT